MLPQTTQNVLHIDDRIVHHFTERDDQARKDHRVDRLPPPAQQHQRNRERQRNRHHTDDRRPPVAEKQR